MVSCCGNCFCGKCILRHMQTKRTCPTCRAAIDVGSLKWVLDVSSEPQDISSNNYKTRIENTIDILKGDSNSQAIIYIMYDNVYYQLASRLEEVGIKADKLDLNLFSVERKINAFKNGEIRALCVSNSDYIRGFSLPEATHVIFFHALSFYELRELLIHSAQRLGRKSPLSVVHYESEFDL